MKLLEKVLTLIGWNRSASEELQSRELSVDISQALQRNERVSENARKAIQEAFTDHDEMSRTLKSIVGNMK